MSPEQQIQQAPRRNSHAGVVMGGTSLLDDIGARCSLGEWREAA